MILASHRKIGEVSTPGRKKNELYGSEAGAGPLAMLVFEEG